MSPEKGFLFIHDRYIDPVWRGLPRRNRVINLKQKYDRPTDRNVKKEICPFFLKVEQ